MPPKFGQAGQSKPTSDTPLATAVKHAGKKRSRQTFSGKPQFNGSDLVGGSTFRGKGQHEGLPTAIAESYANGAKDKEGKLRKWTSFKSSGNPWDAHTQKAYEAGFKLGNKYFPLARADAVRALTERTVLVSPAGKNSGGGQLKV